MLRASTHNISTGGVYFEVDLTDGTAAPVPDAMIDLDLTVPPGDTTFSTTPLYFYGIPLPVLAIISWEDNFQFPHIDLAYSSSAVCGKDKVSAANVKRQCEAGKARTLARMRKPAQALAVPVYSDGGDRDGGGLYSERARRPRPAFPARRRHHDYAVQLAYA